MEEQKKKIGMEVLPSVHRKLKTAAVSRGVPLWLAVQRAFEAEAARLSGDSSPESQDGLTADERDILAILSEDPKRGFLFQATQTSVKNAIKEYREKWKPRRAPSQKKTASKSVDDERRTTGT